MSTDSNPLHLIKTFGQLVKYLRDELDWPIESDDFEELTFDYAPEELGLDAATAVKIKDIKQLRPLTSKQPWGIFFVNFAPKQLPVVALRRILSTLVLKKRQSANKSQQAAWRLHDLLFISSYGETEHRDITFAHFADEQGTSDLPTLRLLGWDDEDTKLKVDFVERELRTKLRWPDDESNVADWRVKWSAAFRLRPREVIKTSQQLAIQLADLARGIRKRANNVLAVESAKGPLRKMHAAFKEALIHDLTADDFADMYAQTIAYGLLTARISRPAGLVADNLAEMVPVTNPFLKELLETFLTIGGRKAKIDFDELGINDVVQLLRDADMEAVLRDFGDRNPQEDPVIHFYELFLKEYDAKKRMERGVFYTPRPVVAYIVHSVHELLQTELGLQDGLADITTWGEMSKRNKNLEIPHGVRPDEPFVQVLDPATGTGTFLVEAIDVIRRAMENRWHKQGHMALEFQNLWNEYVPKHLLPRIHGYELLMAPYAIAHMKIGLKLFETGYRFESDARARVYLTNSLEPADGDAEQISFAELVPALAHEAKAVSTIKRHQRFTVVIGNPPYSGISANMTEEAQELISAYRIVDGQALNEKKLWLQDDYVKFLRLGQTTIERAGIGVLGFITNHGYIDNPTFRGMRQSLMHTFQFLSVLDLHGNANKKEKSVDGSEDKNVFDIRQGVAICLSVRGGMRETVRHSDLWGSRDTKYSWLTNHRVGNTAFTSLAPDSPYYFFQPQNTDRRDEYDSGWKINEVMPVYSAGFITARDHFVVDFDRDSLLERIADFADPKLSDEKIRTKYFAGCGSNKYPDGDTRGWKVPEARKRVRADKNWRERVRRCLYRPFDVREVYWTEWMVDWPRPELTRHLDLSKSPALITTRITKDIFSVFVTALPPGHKSVGAYDVNYVFPLKTAPSGEPGSRLLLDNRKPQPNLAPAFLDGLVAALHSNQNSHPSRDEVPTAEDVFFYVYAVLHSPGYRTRYAEFLKIDFPRLPLTGNRELFRALARLGEELVDLHLLKALRLDTAISDYIGPKSPEVEKISYARHAVWVDKEQTCGFKGVPEAVWDFHIGGYQVCEKWLKDRKGRKLSKGDVTHYNKIVVALSETIRLMKKIDEVIDKHGGWPGAFASAHQTTN